MPVAGKVQAKKPWIFAYDNSMILSLLVDEPKEGWVTLAFSDESDPLALNSQMFYVPQEQFDIIVQEYTTCIKVTS